ncbi:MAG: low affinity iron permease family protein [Paracoccaceae bacterium]
MATQRRPFLRFSNAVAETSGKPIAFISALSLIIVWAVSGPFFKFSSNWQMVVNTGTTIITFLMVFLLQNAQNRDSRAVQAKLDELIISGSADNRFVGLENLDADELRKLSLRLVDLAGTRLDESPLDGGEPEVDVRRNSPVDEGVLTAKTG